METGSITHSQRYIVTYKRTHQNHLEKFNRLSENCSRLIGVTGGGGGGLADGALLTFDRSDGAEPDEVTSMPERQARSGGWNARLSRACQSPDDWLLSAGWNCSQDGEGPLGSSIVVRMSRFHLSTSLASTLCRYVQSWAKVSGTTRYFRAASI